jgi:hypothetical protein
MFPPKSLGLTLVACVYAAAAPQSLSNLYDGCEFTVDRSRYDLCPLFRGGQDGVAKIRTEPASTTQPSYEISFNGPLIPQSGEEAEPQVRATDAVAPLSKSGLITVSVPSRHVGLFERQVFPFICRRRSDVLFQGVVGTLKIQNHTSPKPSRSQATLRSAYPRPQLLPVPTSALTTTPTMVGTGAIFITVLWRLNVAVSPGNLEIDLKGGMWRNQPQAAHFRFICDRNAREVCKRALLLPDISLVAASLLAFPSDIYRYNCRNPQLRVVNLERLCKGTPEFQCTRRGRRCPIHRRRHSIGR